MFSLLSTAYAQDGGDDFFDDEDEDYTAPYDPGSVRDEPYVPPSPQNSNIGQSQAPNVSGGGQTSTLGGGNSAVNDDAVQFKLVDPPKYWKPKKRKYRQKPSNGF